MFNEKNMLFIADNFNDILTANNNTRKYEDTAFENAQNGIKSYLDEKIEDVKTELSKNMEQAERVSFNLLVISPLENIRYIFDDFLDGLGTTTFKNLCKSTESSPHRILNNVISNIFSPNIQFLLKQQCFTDKSYNNIISIHEKAFKQLIFFYSMCKVVFDKDNVQYEAVQRAIENYHDLFKRYVENLNEFRKKNYFTQQNFERLLPPGLSAEKIKTTLETNFESLAEIYFVIIISRPQNSFFSSLIYSCPKGHCVTVLNYGKKEVFILKNIPSKNYKICSKYSELENEEKASEWCKQEQNQYTTLTKFGNIWKECNNFNAYILVSSELEPKMSSEVDAKAFRRSYFNLKECYGSQVYLFAGMQACSDSEICVEENDN